MQAAVFAQREAPAASGQNTVVSGR